MVKSKIVYVSINKDREMVFEGNGWLIWTTISKGLKCSETGQCPLSIINFCTNKNSSISLQVNHQHPL